MRTPRSTRRGTSPGLSGMRYEHLKVMLDNEDAMELVGFAACRMFWPDAVTGVRDRLEDTGRGDPLWVEADARVFERETNASSSVDDGSRHSSP